MKTTLLLVLLFLVSCEYPPEHLLGLHNHAYQVNIINYYASGILTVHDYSVHKDCDTCDTFMVFRGRYKYNELLYGESTYFVCEANHNFAIELIPYDITIYPNTWYLRVNKGNRYKHYEIILEP